MSTVINTNSMATRTANIFNRNNAMMNGALTRLATQQRINSAKDNASTYAISERMRERIRANDQANRNSQNDAALLKTAQGGLDNTLSILTTLKERAIDAANDSNINTNRQAIVTEVQSLVQQIDDNANKVKFNGRTLLNGAVDSSSSSTTSNAVTVTDPKGSHAVYGLTNLKKAGTGATSTTATIASDTKLVDLVDGNGKSLFSVGDRVTLSWKENGTTISKSTEVAAGTTITALATGSKLETKFVAAGTQFNGGTAVKDQNGEALNASVTGLYFIGKSDTVKITDFSLSVTTANSDGTRIAKSSTEAALKLEGIQQSYGPTVGSNRVFAKGATDFIGSGTAGTAGADLNAMLDVAYGAGSTIKVNNTDVYVNGNDTIETLNAKFAEKGLNVRAQYADKGDILSYEGVAVTRGTADDQGVVRAGLADVYFIGAAGEEIESIKIGGTATQDLLKLSSDASGNSGGSMLPQGNALTFFVGGEANFGVNFAIGKATAGNLLGSGASAFASKFATSEGAQSAIGIIDNAITKTLNEQARLGSMESRMGYISDNLTTMNENLESADSVLRDTDPAREMANYMKYMVMSQAAQYMMVQANQNAFQVANLLQP